MGSERSFILMKLYWHRYLVFNLGNCAMKLATCTETGLRRLYIDKEALGLNPRKHVSAACVEAS